MPINYMNIFDNAPITILLAGGLYCLIMTVDNGNAFVLERSNASMATADLAFGCEWVVTERCTRAIRLRTVYTT